MATAACCATPRAPASCSTTSPDMFRAETAESEDEADRWYDDHTAGRRPPELLPRDEVARSINSEVKAGRGSPHGGVFLDIATRRTPEDIRRRLPSMYHQFKELAGVDITAEAMEVGPDLPLHHGRRPGRRRHHGGHRAGALRRRRGGRRHARRQPAGRQLALGPPGLRPAGRHRRRRVRPGPQRRRHPRRGPDPAGHRRRRRPVRREESGENPYDIQQRPAGDHAEPGRASSAPAPSSRRPSARSRSSRSGRRTWPSRAARTYNPGWNLATDLPVHAHRVALHDHGRAQPQGEPRRPDPRRLPDGRPRDGQGQLRRAHRRPVGRPRGAGGTPSVRSITSQPEPVPVMPDDLRALLEEAL